MTRQHLITATIALAMGLSISVAAQDVTAADGGTVTGKVLFKGTPPARPAINFGAEKQCAIVHGDHPPLAEDVIVNSNGTLKNVLVYVTGEVPGTFAPPATPVTYEQKGCVFHPHVAAVMVGQPIEVLNGDDVLHNVRTQAKINPRFNIAQPTKGQKTTKVMHKQEIGIPLRCDVHFWMTAYLHVLAHPFFALTGDDGTFAIPRLPDGTYTLEAWHEKLGTQHAQVTIKAGAPASTDFTFSAS